MKFNRKTAVLIIIAVAVLLSAVVFLASSGDPEKNDVRSWGLNDNDDRLEYLSSLGWQVEAEPADTKTVVIPREFDAVYQDYNELQKSQGFDLSEYCGMEVTVYTYNVTNYPSSGNGSVQAELYIKNGRVVAGDIHSTALDGFMHGLTTE